MNVAFIPAREGSRSIPLKNIKPFCGEPLIYWTTKAACECKYFDIVYISTDSEIIRTAINRFADKPPFSDKVQIINRSAESASDIAPTELAMMEFAENYDFENIALIQATSPLLTANDLNGGFDLFSTDSTDSVLSVVRQHRFLWRQNEDGYASSPNYDFIHRPRRQEFNGYLMENGAFYITSKENLLRSGSRISGKIRAYEMCEESAYEIDTPSDWIVVEELMKKNIAQKKEKISNVRMLLTDCDGCLTDAGMYYSESGDELKKFNTRDGMGFAMLQEKGILTGIVTSESMKLNERRADKLNLDILIEGCSDKPSAIRNLCEERQIPLSDVVYIGDDINDEETIRMVGWGCCPSDAMPSVKTASDYIANAKGGEGVVREVAEIILGMNS